MTMKTVAHFELVEKLGAGGMGIVYKAHDTRLQRIVALKLVSPDVSKLPSGSKRQLREARAAGALNHPNIATIYEVGDAGDGNFIAMEYVDGEALYRRVRPTPPPVPTALEWGSQVCEALAAAHDMGIVHRDIKSTNIMITRDNRVKVLDFGLARRRVSEGATEGARVTDTGSIIGTIDYMAPELLRGEEASPCSDVFSVGVVLFEMLTGRLPFEGPAAVAVMYAIANERPPALTELIGGLPQEVDDIVQRAMAKDPSERYPTCRELADDMRKITRGGTRPRIPEAKSARTEAEIPSNLPAPTTSFVGREKELAELESRIAENRLVTITGPGGAGKTRTSLELAGRLRGAFPDGVFIVELAPLTEPTQLIPQIARVLGVREESQGELIDTVVDVLGEHRLLLLLDNCEHLIEASAGAAARILESAPNVKIIATSQHRMGIPGEVVWQLSTLSLPRASARSIDDLSRYEAVQLFVDRAIRVKSGFVISARNAPAVIQICRHLDGIPLGIELAAARVRLLSPEKILERLEDRFRLLTGGSRTSLPRQQTLRATVEWSLDLLDEEERRLFRALSVFAGGMSIEAVERVCGEVCGPSEEVLDLLGRLVDKSLVVVRDGLDGELRFSLLETLREYGAAELSQTGDEDIIRARHADFVLELAEMAECELAGPNQVQWFDRLDVEADNVRAAIRWLVKSGRGEQALAICGAIWRLWQVRGYLGTGRRLLASALDATQTPNETRARALHGAGVLANDQGDYKDAIRLLEECLAIRRVEGDRGGVAQTLNSLGIAARDCGDYATARRLLEESLSINREIGDDAGAATSIHALGITAHRDGDCAVARSLFEEGLSIRRKLGDRRGIAALLAHVGSVDHDIGNFDDAEPLLEEALAIFRELGNKRGIVFAQMHLGGVAQHRGDFAKARAHHAECLAISRDLGDKQHIVRTLERMASLAAAEGRHALAIELDGAATALRKKFGTPRTPMEKQVLDRELTRAAVALGAEGTKRAHREGRGHTLESAVALVEKI